MSLTCTLGGLPILHPRPEYEAAVREGTTQAFWGQANSVEIPRGREPGKAFFLMLRRDLAKLDADDFIELQWRDTMAPASANVLTLPKLLLVKSYCINRARPTDTKAAMLVELHDQRRLFQWTSAEKQYNVRIPAPAATSGTDLYYTDSLNGAALWTWQTMLDDLWGLLPSNAAGDSPNLPYTPNAPPENWRFIGVSAWEAINDVLDRVGCTIALNPITGVFSYVRLGTTQTDLADSKEQLEAQREFDFDAADYEYTHIPKTIRVFFMRREEYHGVEKDTPDSCNWEMEPVETKDYTANADAETDTTMAVWSDLPALYNSGGSNSNSSELQLRADEIGANIKNRLEKSDTPSRLIYTGLIFPGKTGGMKMEVLPGSEVQAIRWRDYGDSWGLVTELVQRDSIVNPDAPHEFLSTRDWPLYPRVCQPVRTTDTSPNASGYYGGTVERCAGGTWSALESCWIKVCDAGVSSLTSGDRFVGRLFGNGTDSGDTRPLYVVRVGGSATGAYNFDVSADTGGPFTIAAGDTIDFDATDVSFADEANGTKADRGIVVIAEDAGTTTTIRHAVDKSVLQQIELSGEFDSTHSPILVRDGTRNSITFDATSATVPPIQMAESAATSGVIDVSARNPFHTISDDDDPVNSEDLDYRDTLILQAEDGYFEVTRDAGAGETTAKLRDNGLPIGSIIMSWEAPIEGAGEDAGKYYLDRDGAADKDWAFMDGTSNASPGASGIKMYDHNMSGDTFFVRARKALTDAADTAFGRSVQPTPDDDEVEIDIADHDDHSHQIDTDACDNDHLGTDSNQYEFATDDPHTGGVRSVAGGAAGTGVLGHQVTLTNNQGSAADKIELTPPYKALHFFERIAKGSND